MNGPQQVVADREILAAPQNQFILILQAAVLVILQKYRRVGRAQMLCSVCHPAMIQLANVADRILTNSALQNRLDAIL